MLEKPGQDRNGALKTFAAAAVILFFAAFLLMPFFIFQQIPYAGDFTGSDLTELNLPLRFLAAQQWRNDTLPVWSDLLSDGFPLLAEGQAGVLYPPNFLLFTALPLPLALLLSLLLHFTLAGIFTYWLARGLGVSRGGALVAAMSFAFSGFFIFRIKHLNLIQAAVWLPLVLLLIEKFFRSKRAPSLWVIGLGAVLAVQFLAGHPQISYLTVLTGFGYFVLRFLVERPSLGRFLSKTFVVWASVALLACGLAAAQLLPTMELTRLSSRSQWIDYASATRFAYHPTQLQTFVAPFRFGNPADATYRQSIEHVGIFWESNVYFGLLPLLLGCIALALRRRTPSVQLLLLLMLGAFFLVFGKYNPFFPLAWEFLPGLQLFRFPQRFLLVVVLAFTLLAGFGFDAIAERLRNISAIQKRLKKSRLLGPGVLAIVLLVIALDLSQLPFRYWGSMPDADFLPPESATVLHAKGAQDYRIYSVGWPEAWANVYRVSDGWLNNMQLYSAYRLLLAPNTNVYAGLAAVDDRALLEGGQVYAPKATLQHILQGATQPTAEGLHFSEPLVRLWGSQSAKYFLSFLPLDAAGLTLVEQIPAGVHPPLRVYENAHALPRAYGVYHAQSAMSDDDALRQLFAADFNPARSVVLRAAVAIGGPAPTTMPNVHIERWHNGSVQLSVEFDRSGYVVLSQTNYPGWRAWLDDAPVPILAANTAFQAIAVPPGTHRIGLVFDSLPVRVGRWISLISILLAVGYAMVVWLRSRPVRLPILTPPFSYLALGYLLLLLGYAFSKGMYLRGGQLLWLLAAFGVLLFAGQRRLPQLRFWPQQPASLLMVLLTVSMVLSLYLDGGIYGQQPLLSSFIFSMQMGAIFLTIFYWLPPLAGERNGWQAAGKWLQRHAFLLLILIAFSLRVATIVAAPEPAIDVYYLLHGGAQALLAGQNPYTATFENPYGFAGLYFVRDSYAYFPGMLAFSLPMLWIFGDIRFGYIFATLLTALLWYRMARQAKQGRELAQLLVLTLLWHPLSLFVLEQSWVEPVLLFGLTVFAWALVRQRRILAGVALGMLLGVKQTMLGFLPFVWLVRRNLRWSGITTAAGVCVALLVPFVVVSPADFFHDTAGVLASTPPALHSLSLNTPFRLLMGTDLPAPFVGSVLLLLLVALLARLERGQVSVAIFGISLLLLATFILWQGFANYFYFSSLGVLLVMVLQLGAAQSRRG